MTTATKKPSWSWDPNKWKKTLKTWAGESERTEAIRITSDPPFYWRPSFWYTKQLIQRATERALQGNSKQLHDKEYAEYVGIVRDLAVKDQGGEPDPDKLAKAGEMGQWIKGLLDNADMSVVSGYSPATRATNYIATLAAMQQNRMVPKNGEGGEGGGKETAEALNKAWEDYQNMTKEERENEGMFFHNGWDTNTHDMSAAQVVAGRLSHKTQDMIDKISRNLDVADMSAVSWETGFTESPGGPHVKPRNIDGSHEIPYLASHELARLVMMPQMALQRIVSHEADVLIRGEKFKKQQMAVIVVDVSGSMFGQNEDGVTAAMGAYAILRNRIDHAAKGHAVVWIVYFATSVSKAIRVTPEYAADIGKHFRQEVSQRGGGTDMPNGIIRAMQFIKENFNPETGTIPEIIGITDGYTDWGKGVDNPEFYNVGTKQARFNCFITGAGDVQRAKTAARGYGGGHARSIGQTAEATGGKYVAVVSNGGMWDIPSGKEIRK